MEEDKKILFILPGFGMDCSTPEFREIAKKAKKIGYKVIPVNFKWERSTIEDWVAFFLEKLNKNPYSKDSTIIGFSFGAEVASICTQNIKIGKLVLCSISPYFSETMKMIPDSAWKFLGTKRKNAFAKYKIPLNNNETHFLFGDKDWPLGIATCKKMYKKWENEKNTFDLVKNTGHELTENYIEDIVKNL